MEKKWFKNFILFEPKHRTPKSLDYGLLIATLTVLIFVPYIPLSESMFLSLEEVFVGLIGIRILTLGFFWIDKFVVIIIGFAILVLLSILFNVNRTELREYFEVYKFAKIAILYIYSIFLFIGNTDYKWAIKFVNYSFVALVVFNFLHYFNVCDFNKHVTILFDSDQRDTLTFGLNSIGERSTKRMIGTMGNPNNNALLLLFYFAFYLARISILKPVPSRLMIYRFAFFLAALLVLLCQSRTGVVIAIGLYGLSLLQRKWTKDIFYEIGLLAGAVLSMLSLGSTAFLYISNTSMNLVENTAVIGRMEAGKKLLAECLNRPIIGHGPNKTFMYANNVYPENEYIFQMWRYGVIGVVFFCLSLWYLIVKFYREKVKMPLFSFVIAIFTVAALTNAPLLDPKLTFIFAIASGIATCEYLRIKRKLNESDTEV